MLGKILKPFNKASPEGIFRAIPLNTRGKLFVSPMPFGAYDTGNRLIKLYQQGHIRHVFILVQDKEIKAKAKRDIRLEYPRIGASFSHYPFVDMHAPDLGAIAELVGKAKDHLARHNVAIHCHAGVGRTSVAVCCVVQSALGKPAKDSIVYVKKHMNVDMTTEQMAVVERFGDYLAGVTIS